MLKTMFVTHSDKSPNFATQYWGYFSQAYFTITDLITQPGEVLFGTEAPREKGRIFQRWKYNYVRLCLDAFEVHKGRKKLAESN